MKFKSIPYLENKHQFSLHQHLLDPFKKSLYYQCSHYVIKKGKNAETGIELDIKIYSHYVIKKGKKMPRPGIEPGTFRSSV